MPTPDRITSTGNPRIKQIRKLRDRKERDLSGLFYVEGLRILAEAIQMGAQLDTLVVAPDLLESDFGWKLVAEQRQAGTSILEVSADVFKSIAIKEGPQGAAAVVRQQWTPLEGISLQEGGNWIALDSAQDPGNVGTILRTSDAVGFTGVILLDQSTDPYDQTCVRASMGAVFSQKLVKTKFEGFARWKTQSGYPLVGTSGQASQDYQELPYPNPLVLLMGSERQGLQEPLLRLCDQLVSIPMVGRSDSLNLAVATGIILYEIFNQRKKIRET